MKRWVIIKSVKGVPAIQVGSTFTTYNAALIERNRLQIDQRNRVVMDPPFPEVTYRIKEMIVKDAG